MGGFNPDFESSSYRPEELPTSEELKKAVERSQMELDKRDEEVDKRIKAGLEELYNTDVGKQIQELYSTDIGKKIRDYEDAKKDRDIEKEVKEAVKKALEEAKEEAEKGG